MKSPIRDGNIIPSLRNMMVLFGLVVIFVGIKFFRGWVAYVCVTIGLMVGAVGVYSARAAIFGLRPFCESEWRKAKKTYENNNK